MLEPLDHQNLLQMTLSLATPCQMRWRHAPLTELGIESEAAPITELRHVRSNAEKKAAEEIANREKCRTSKTFKPLFEQVQRELEPASE